MRQFIREGLEAVFSIVVVGLSIYAVTLAISLGWHQGKAIIGLYDDLKVIDRFSEISKEYNQRKLLKGE